MCLLGECIHGLYTMSDRESPMGVGGGSGVGWGLHCLSQPVLLANIKNIIFISLHEMNIIICAHANK